MQINSRTKTIKLTKREKQTLLDAIEIVIVYAAQPFVKLPDDALSTTVVTLADIVNCQSKGGDDD